MMKGLAYVLFVCALFACIPLTPGVTLRATASQDRTPQPGQPTQARVWIENRGAADAVPVVIQNMAGDAPPLRVQVIGAPTVTSGAAREQTRAVRPLWEYQNLTLASGQDPAALLNAAGANGWETTGLTVAAQGGTIVVMKRPR